MFERLRRSRHGAQYPDVANPPFTTADATWAMEKADAALDCASRLIRSGGLTLFPTEE